MCQSLGRQLATHVEDTYEYFYPVSRVLNWKQRRHCATCRRHCAGTDLGRCAFGNAVHGYHELVLRQFVNLLATLRIIVIKSSIRAERFDELHSDQSSLHATEIAIGLPRSCVGYTL